MKHSLSLFLSAALAGLLLTGCSTPYAVKDLAQQTRSAASHMGDVHQQDLRTLGAYDVARVAQFNRLLNEYLSLRGQIVNSLNEALDKSKRASLAELDRDFDQQAEHLMTSVFWTDFRQAADAELNKNLLKERERSIAKTSAADAYPKDLEASSQAMLAARQRYLAAAIAYETVESSFAELVIKIDKARSEYRTANERLFAEIKPLTLTNLPSEVTSFTLPDNTEAINERIADLRHAYTMLDNAHGEIARYLSENNSGADFLLGVAKGIAGLNTANDDAAKNPVPGSPTEPPDAQLPGLGGILSALPGKLDLVQIQKSLAESALGPLFANLAEKVRPVVRLIPVPTTGGSDNSTPTSPTQP